MDGGAVAGFTTIGVLVVGNAIVVAYSYGKVRQSVSDLCRRVGKIEDNMNTGGKRKVKK